MSRQIVIVGQGPVDDIVLPFERSWWRRWRTVEWSFALESVFVSLWEVWSGCELWIDLERELPVKRRQSYTIGAFQTLLSSQVGKKA